MQPRTSEQRVSQVPQLESIETVRPSVLVARRLRAAILNGEVPPGKPLPPEAELATQLGISQHRLREATRILEAEGLVQVRPGRNGGIFPTVPNEHTLARAFASLLCFHKATLADVLAARSYIEPDCIELAVLNATKEDIDHLWQLVHKVEEATRKGMLVSDANAEFHVGLAMAAHNQTLRFLMASIQMLISAIDAWVANLDLQHESVRAHRALIHTIESRDVAAARKLMGAHILGFQEAIRRAGVDVAHMTVLDVS